MLNKKSLIPIIITIIVVLFSALYKPEIAEVNKIQSSFEFFGIFKNKEKHKELENKKSNVQVDYDTKSGPVTVLPWENDEDFKKAIKENENLNLLGAYHTVLRDPLPGEEYNVHLAARMLAGKIIKPGEIFSQNGQIGPYTQERGFRSGPTYIGSKLTTTIGGGVCKIASTLYNVTVISDLKIIERHPHGMPAPYVPGGQDATVAYGAKDFKFKNSSGDNIMIWAKGIDNTLFMAFYGKYTPREIEWHHETLDVVKAPVIYKLSTDLPKNMERKVLEGADGITVKSWLTVKNPDGTMETRELGLSSYKPMAHIVEKGK